ncbi:YfbU family protein [Psychrobacter sp. VH5]|uniref:YfbU family protein n=1 Tax=Psychrobacter sp. VH5 TaxID=3423439 RepID=UPI003D65A0EE
MDKLKRYELINQLLILEKLYPDEADYHAKNRKALEYGFELQYSWLTENLSEGLTTEECKEVLDILDMYRSITFSWLNNNSGAEIPNSIKFKGFDGNNESALRNYVQYFVLDLERFEELKYGQSFPQFNSHTRMLEQYRRQLKVWRNFDFDLTTEQIALILEA